MRWWGVGAVGGSAISAVAPTSLVGLPSAELRTTTLGQGRSGGRGAHRTGDSIVLGGGGESRLPLGTISLPGNYDRQGQVITSATRFTSTQLETPAEGLETPAEGLETPAEGLETPAEGLEQAPRNISLDDLTLVEEADLPPLISEEKPSILDGPAGPIEAARQELTQKAQEVATPASEGSTPEALADHAATAELRVRDAAVRAHEAAHKAAGGAMVGGASFTYQLGPDGQAYAIGGEVTIRMPNAAEPEMRLQQAELLRRAALAPRDPSGADLRVAASAGQVANEARSQIRAARLEDLAAAAPFSPDPNSPTRAAALRPVDGTGDMSPAEARSAQAGGSVAGTTHAIAEHARTTGLDRLDQSVAAGPISVTLGPQVEPALEPTAPHERLADALAFVGSGDKMVPTPVRGAVVTVGQ